MHGHREITDPRRVAWTILTAFIGQRKEWKNVQIINKEDDI